MSSKRQACGFVLCLVVLVCFDCASVTKPKENDLRSVVKLFHHDLRWKYHRAAVGRIISENAIQFREAIEAIEEDLNITSIEVRQVEMQSASKTAIIQISLKYYLMPSTVLQTEKIEQVWKLRDNRWFLFSMNKGPLAFGGQTPKKESNTTPASSPNRSQKP